MDWKAVDPTESTDITEVIDLLDVSFPVDRAYIEREVTKSLSDPDLSGRLYRLRSETGDMIATVTYGQLYGDGWDGETFVRFFAVHPDHRRQGYATWIIDKIIQASRASGSRCIVLACRQSNTLAAGIWKRRGFTVYRHAVQPEAYPEYGLHDYYVYWFSE